MLTVLVATILGLGFALPGTIYGCREPLSPQHLVYNLQTSGTIVSVNSAVTNRPVCTFERISSSGIVNNLYRLHGRVRLANSKSLANLYRNTVGNGGYIEVWPETPTPSVLLNFLARFQPNKVEEMPSRIHVSSKLVGGIYELEITESSVKYLWSVEGAKLVRVDGYDVADAAKIVSIGPNRHLLHVHEEVIGPFVAMCTCLSCIS